MDGGEPVERFRPAGSHAVRDDIVPLLQEYCYEDYDALERILGKQLVDREHQRIRHELFDPIRTDELVSALLSACARHRHLELGNRSSDQQARRRVERRRRGTGEGEPEALRQ